jgi:dGTPase
MFARVYLRPEVEDQRRQAIRVIRDLVDHYLERPGDIPETYRHEEADTITQAIDYVAGMTDRYALREWERLCR